MFLEFRDSLASIISLASGRFSNTAKHDSRPEKPFILIFNIEKDFAFSAAFLIFAGVSTDNVKAVFLGLASGIFKSSDIDLDGPLLLLKDRKSSMNYEKGIVHPAKRELWG